MRADADIERDVQAELQWTPEVDQTDIAVKVNGGVVTLTGYAKSYFEKYRAEAAVKRVAGVRAVANDLAVRAPMSGLPPDPEIAHNVVAALRSELPLMWENIKPLVHEGHVGLEGTVERHYERESAEAAARRVPGVMSVRNDAQGIMVDARGGEVTLRGEVRSWAEHDQAQQMAWAAPGVTHVNNELTIRT